MRAWHRHRSAPLGVLLAGAVALLVTGTVAAVFYLSIVRGARGLPVYTVGIRPASLDRPAFDRIAAYHVRLAGPPERTTPAGTPSTAHHWRVTAHSAPDDPLCEGQADDALVATDDSGASRGVALALPAGFYAPGVARAVPPRLLAVCPEVAQRSHGGGLEYTEEVVPRGVPVEIVACIDPRAQPPALNVCADGAPSRIYPREPRAMARVRVRGAMLRVGGCAGTFVLVCFVVGLLALRRFDRDRLREGRLAPGGRA